MRRKLNAAQGWGKRRGEANTAVSSYRPKLFFIDCSMFWIIGRSIEPIGVLSALLARKRTEMQWIPRSK